MAIRVNSGNLFRWSLYLLVILICLPVGMLIPSILRMPLQVLTAALFVAGLVLLRKPLYLLSLFFLLLLSGVYYVGAWDEKMSATSFLFNSLSCWEILVYTLLCIRGLVKPDRKLFWMIVGITCITAITTLIGLQEYPLAVRELGRTESYTGQDIGILKEVYRSRNIASWSQLFGMVFVQGGLAHIWKKTHKVTILAVLLVNELCILQAQVALAILFSILILLLTFTNVASKNYCLIVAAAVFLAVIVCLALEPILQWALQLAEENQQQMLLLKLQDLYNLLVARTVVGDAKARFELYAMSLGALAQFPFGLFLQSGVQAVEFIGFHSDFFDIIGTLGIFGVMLLVIGILVWVFSLRRIQSSYDHRFMVYMFLSFLLMFIMNPVFYSPQMWVGAFLLPVMTIQIEGCSCVVCTGSRRKRVHVSLRNV